MPLPLSLTNKDSAFERLLDIIAVAIARRRLGNRASHERTCEDAKTDTTAPHSSDGRQRVRR